MLYNTEGIPFVIPYVTPIAKRTAYRGSHSDFWNVLRLQELLKCKAFEDLIRSFRFEEKGLQKQIRYSEPLNEVRIAILAGFTPHPLCDLIEHLLWCHGYRAECFLGEYDNSIAEILESQSPLYDFKPQLVFFLFRRFIAAAI